MSGRPIHSLAFALATLLASAGVLAAQPEGFQRKSPQN